MSEIEARPASELVLPHSGEVIDLADVEVAGTTLEQLRTMEQAMREAQRMITDALVEHSRVAGSKTLDIGGGRRIEIRGGVEKVYDAEQLEQELRDLGMPEERIREIVKEEITHTVSAREAQRAAKANDDYAAALERATVEREKPYTATIRKG